MTLGRSRRLALRASPGQSSGTATLPDAGRQSSLLRTGTRTGEHSPPRSTGGRRALAVRTSQLRPRHPAHCGPWTPHVPPLRRRVPAHPARPSRNPASTENPSPTANPSSSDLSALHPDRSVCLITVTMHQTEPHDLLAGPSPTPRPRRCVRCVLN